MADNLLNIGLPRGIWVDLYFESGILVGEAISVENIGVCDVYLTVQADQPPPDHDAYNIVQRENGFRLRNSEGDSGAWALCPHNNGKVSVRELEV